MLDIIRSTISLNEVEGVQYPAAGNGVSIGLGSSLNSNSSIIWGNQGLFNDIDEVGGSANKLHNHRF